MARLVLVAVMLALLGALAVPLALSWEPERTLRSGNQGDYACWAEGYGAAKCKLRCREGDIGHIEAFSEDPAPIQVDVTGHIGCSGIGGECGWGVLSCAGATTLGAPVDGQGYCFAGSVEFPWTRDFVRVRCWFEAAGTPAAA